MFDFGLTLPFVALSFLTMMGASRLGGDRLEREMQTCQRPCDLSVHASVRSLEWTGADLEVLNALWYAPMTEVLL